MNEVYKHGFRSDGRTPSEIRGISIKIEDKLQGSGGISAHVCYTQGNTRIIATVIGPHECSPGVTASGTASHAAPVISPFAADTTAGAPHLFDSNSGGAVITCVYKCPASANSAGYRSAARQLQHRKSSAQSVSSRGAADNLREIFCMVVERAAYPHCQIDLCCHVVQSDGSEFACAVNALSLAVCAAGIRMRDLVCAASVGVIQQRCEQPLSMTQQHGRRGHDDALVLADLNRFEEKGARRSTNHCTSTTSQSGGGSAGSGLAQLTLALLPNHHEPDQNDATVKSGGDGEACGGGGTIVYSELASWIHVSRLAHLMQHGRRVVRTIHAHLRQHLLDHVALRFQLNAMGLTVLGETNALPLPDLEQQDEQQEQDQQVAQEAHKEQCC